jgi:predicted nucleic acid-binding protein
MVKALLDTNILIDFLNAVPDARAELNRYDDKAISIITWMEVLIGAPANATRATREFLDRFQPDCAGRKWSISLFDHVIHTLERSALRDHALDGFELIELNEVIAERAVRLRQQHRLKLPDAIIWASALAHSMLLVTRDTKVFPADDPGVRVPYQSAAIAD